MEPHRPRTTNGASPNGNGVHPPRASSLAEQQVLGHLILSDVKAQGFQEPHVQEQAQRVTEWLRPAMFQHPQLRAIATAVLGARREGLTCDPATLMVLLERAGTLEQAGGPEALANLVEGTYGAGNLEYHAELVRAEAKRKRLQDALARAARSATDPSLSAEETLSWLRDWLQEEAPVEAQADVAAAYTPVSVLLAQPELLQPPECVLPRVAYRGRLTLLCGPDKCGKSTFMAHAIAKLTSRGTFLGGDVGHRAGKVLLLGLEEAPADQVRRLGELGVWEGVDLLTSVPDDIIATTSASLEEAPADLIVVDSLQEYARVAKGTAPEDGDNATWGTLVRSWVSLARRHDVAVVILHHVRRSDGQFRGAGEIAAAADCLLEMALDDADPTVRKVRGRARWTVEPFSVALRNGRYDLARGELSVGELLMIYIRDHPGCNGREIRDAIPGRTSVTLETLHERVARGLVVCVPGKPPRGDRYYVEWAAPVPDPELGEL